MSHLRELYELCMLKYGDRSIIQVLKVVRDILSFIEGHVSSENQELTDNLA